MKRRDLLKTGLLGALVAPFYAPTLSNALSNPAKNKEKKAKNIIFLVSDGMSQGTLTLGELASQRLYGKSSNWIGAYKSGRATRSLMETSSANSLVTDSAAASAAWGSGVKNNNNVLNIAPNGEKKVPILQKFKAAGKAVGCVTTVPITHATPAGFSINNEHRRNQPEIAVQYLGIEFDVMLGGGREFFMGDLRTDKRDLWSEFQKKGFTTVTLRDELLKLDDSKPLIGAFYESGLPYTIDRNQDVDSQAYIPTLAEMTRVAIARMEKNPKGFVLQVEGGKVDWAAHGNDAPALIYDQLAFDEAVGVALDYAEKKGDTLVVITTDHANANPGLFYGSKANANFDRLLAAKHSNDFVFQQIPDNASVAKVIELFEAHQGIILKKEHAELVANRYAKLQEGDRGDARKLPFQEVAEFQREHFSVHFSATEHAADFVELAMVGPGSEQLKPFTVNTELHQFMLDVTGVGKA